MPFGRITPSADWTVGGTPSDVRLTLGTRRLAVATNRPGIFAVGDVRGGNIKRAASAVGEGSIAVRDKAGSRDGASRFWRVPSTFAMLDLGT